MSDSESENGQEEEKEVVQSVEISPEESVKAAEAESLAESNSGTVLNQDFFNFFFLIFFNFDSESTRKSWFFSIFYDWTIVKNWN